MKIALHWQILIAIILACIAGAISNSTPIIWGINSLAIFDFIGTLFMNALMMVIVPLIVASIISGVANMGSSSDMARMLGKLLGFYLFTSTLAILVGLVLVNIIQPGSSPDAQAQLQLSHSIETEQSLAAITNTNSGELVNIFIRMIPTNVVKAAAEGDMLALIFFSMLFGFLMTKLSKEAYQNQVLFWQSVQDIMVMMTMLVMRFAPLGVFGLVALTISQTGLAIFMHLAWFFLTVVLALAFHSLVTLSLVLHALKINPFQHLRAMRGVLLMAFSTSSSVATLPLTMTTLNEQSGVSKKTTAFVTPLGATINMDGTALYECVAAMFIAQVYGLELSFATQLTVVIIALFTSIGVAGIPAASLVAITIILVAVGLPVEGIGLLLVTDRILDMLRTAVNVYGDTVAAVFIAKTEGEKLYSKQQFVPIKQ